MDIISTPGAKGVAVYASAAVSRGILALQGIGSSRIGAFGAFGTQVNSAFTQVDSPVMHAPSRIVLQDKPIAGWHPAAAQAVVGACAEDAGFEPAELRAARLRTAHPATVIRTRHRCRTR